MAELASSQSIPSFGDFLAYLRQQGFDVGIEDYVHVQRLFEKISEDVASERLKTLLCPLFATSESQQEKFYADFDNYISYLQTTRQKTRRTPKGRKGDRDEETKKKSRPGWLRLRTLMILGAIVLALSATLVTVRSCTPSRPTNDNTNANTNAQRTPSTSPAKNSHQANLNSNTGVQPAGTPLVVIQTTPYPSPSPSVAPSPTPQPDSSKPLSYYLVALLLPLLAFLLLELSRYVQRKRILERQHSKQPPYRWTLSPKTNPHSIYDSPEFYRAVRLMRRRQVDEFHRLDILATIAATIRAAGYPSFRYRFASKAPEYLVLINRVSMRDHQARLFSELVRAFQRENVFVIHYFYEDPRICSDETDQERVHLVELQSKYPAHRLLIFGSGAEIVDQFTGELADWTTVLLNWHERALLTPEPPTDWGLREITLSKSFVVLPATIDGLSELVGQIETTAPMSLGSWSSGNAETALNELADSDSGEPSELIESLRRRLGENVFQWLCACAVYPELDWDLTLHLGSLPCMSRNLVSEDNLWRLIRLPWFRQGTIPDNVRWSLMKALDPTREQEVRLALLKLLEDDAPQGRLEQTYAADDYELNVLSQRWLYRRDRKRLRELLEKIKGLPPSRALRDATLTRFLQSTQKLFFNWLLPRSLRQGLFVRGMSFFGFKPIARVALTLTFMAILLFGVPYVPAPPSVAKKETSTSASPSASAQASPSASAQASPSASAQASPSASAQASPSASAQASPSASAQASPSASAQALPTSPCPPIAISECPSEAVEEGELVQLYGKVVTGRPPEEPYEYEWEVSPETASGTKSGNTLLVQTKGFAGQRIRIKLRLRGLSVSNCVNYDSCTIDVRRASTPVSGSIDLEIVLGRSDTEIPGHSGRTSVRVIVRTVKKDGSAVNGLRIWYVPMLSAGTTGAYKSFPQLSSPTEMVLPVGNYRMWATLPSDTKPVSDTIKVRVE